MPPAVGGMPNRVEPRAAHDPPAGVDLVVVGGHGLARAVVVPRHRQQGGRGTRPSRRHRRRTGRHPGRIEVDGIRHCGGDPRRASQHRRLPLQVAVVVARHGHVTRLARVERRGRSDLHEHRRRVRRAAGPGHVHLVGLAVGGEVAGDGVTRRRHHQEHHQPGQQPRPLGHPAPLSIQLIQPSVDQGAGPRSGPILLPRRVQGPDPPCPRRASARSWTARGRAGGASRSGCAAGACPSGRPRPG